MTRIALLVDGDNLSGGYAEHILAQAQGHGRVDIAQVYLNAFRPSEWLTAPGFRAVHSGAGKNASDLLLSIDAMDMALSGGVEGFVLASSDQDFAHLAHRLRYHGRRVHGIGEAKAPAAFRAACGGFTLLPPVLKPVAPDRLPVVTDLDRQARGLIERNSTQGRGMPVALFGAQMGKSGIRISQRPEGTWRKYLADRPDLYDLDPKGPEAMVRFRREAFGP